MMHTGDIWAIGTLLVIAAASAGWKKLTTTAALLGLMLGYMVYAGAGWEGLSMLGAFFAAGTAATSWKKSEKRLIAIHQKTRTAGQVAANGGVAALAGLCMIAWPSGRQVWEIMMAASLASATADTLSSELGMVYGRRTYNILTWKPDQKGRDGVVSVEGLLIGVGGAAVIAGLYALWQGQSAGTAAAIIVLTGTLGNIADSVLGATLERSGNLSNDGVNFCNTLIAAVTAGALTYLL